MDWLTLLLILLIIVAFILWNKKSKITHHKPAALKKDELINMYRRQMKQLIQECSFNPESLALEKSKLLKKIHHELHNNIFFEEDEVKVIIQELASM